MDALLTLLVFAGVFFLMMRFGCGAHMGHGHGAHRSREGQSPGAGSAGSSIDPVCRMPVEAGHGCAEVLRGREYRFCSRACLDRFDGNPDAYAAA